MYLSKIAGDSSPVTPVTSENRGSSPQMTLSAVPAPEQFSRRSLPLDMEPVPVEKQGSGQLESIGEGQHASLHVSTPVPVEITHAHSKGGDESDSSGALGMAAGATEVAILPQGALAVPPRLSGFPSAPALHPAAVAMSTFMSSSSSNREEISARLPHMNEGRLSPSLSARKYTDQDDSYSEWEAPILTPVCQEQVATAWHEVEALPLKDPVTGKQMLLLLQSIITERVELEAKLSAMNETQLGMLEQVGLLLL